MIATDPAVTPASGNHQSSDGIDADILVTGDFWDDRLHSLWTDHPNRKGCEAISIGRRCAGSLTQFSQLDTMIVFHGEEVGT